MRLVYCESAPLKYKSGLHGCPNCGSDSREPPKQIKYYVKSRNGCD